MRSSRLTRQTAQIVDAISPRKRIRNAINSITGRSQTSQTSQESKEEADDVGGLALLSPTDEPSRDAQGVDSKNSAAAANSRKRKRDQDLTSPSSQRSRTKLSTTKEASYTSPTTSSAPARAPYPPKPRRRPAKPHRSSSGTLIRTDAPPDWTRVYALTQDMRAKWPAPVDTMGCERLAEDQRSPRDRRLQTLVALMLSSQTKDGVTAAAMKRLQEGLPGGFTLASLRAVEPALLNSLIGKVGFHNNKTRYLKATAEILAHDHDGDIPATIAGLVALPGVGPKMAYLCMSAAWGRDEGIGVDVHVHRITNLWGWHSTKTPEETRAALEGWLPREKWHEINHMLVGFGQTWCPPVGRRCGECGLAREGLCPSAVVERSVRERVKREVADVEVERGHGETRWEKKVEVEIEVTDVKAEQVRRDEEVARSLVDIEDLGRGARRRSKRIN